MPPPALPYRVGHGFDLHRLEEGPYKLILGGLEIPHDRGCVAHSDGEYTEGGSVNCHRWASSVTSGLAHTDRLSWLCRGCAAAYCDR